MNLNLSNLRPETLWKHFEQICSLPHPSKYEEKIQAYIEKFACDYKIECQRDEVGNIILRKPATPGKERSKKILLQSHMDMVPQKNSDVVHDFLKDGIKPCIRDGHVWSSERTTLGADNGIGMAAMLAIFEANDIAHGPLEALFTVDEEAGMGGALGLKAGLLSSEIMLNLDSEEEGEIFIGCAGGVNTNATAKYHEVTTPSGHESFDLTITGARGGHSGLDIPLKRANAIKLMARLLCALKEKGIVPLIHSFEGGSLRNAIARECFANIAIPATEGKKFFECVHELEKNLITEYAETDPGIKLEAKVNSTNDAVTATVMSSEDSVRFINTIMGVFHGMKNSILGMESVAETSTNLGIVIVKGGKIDIRTLQRSAVESQKFEMAQIVRACFELGGLKVVHELSYPGWKPNFHSEALKIASAVYERMFNKAPKTMVTHGGLECGLITSVYPQMDAISFGPNIRDAHSPNERVEIQSVERFWSYLVEVLKIL